jgi:hypothetical protein
VSWEIVFHPMNLLMYGFIVGSSVFAAMQRDAGLRLVGTTFIVVALVSLPDYKHLPSPVESLVLDLTLFGATTFVAVRQGSNWALFCSAWTILACAASLFTATVYLRGATWDPTLAVTMNMMWFILAAGALLAGAIFSQRSAQAPLPAMPTRLVGGVRGG